MKKEINNNYTISFESSPFWLLKNEKVSEFCSKMMTQEFSQETLTITLSLHNLNKKLKEWKLKVYQNFNDSDFHGLAFDENVLIYYAKNSDNLDIQIVLNSDDTRQISEFFNSYNYSDAKTKSITILYTDEQNRKRWERMNFDRKDVKPEYYPFISKSIKQLAEDFEKSESNILFLYGEPGTGKSTFIKELLYNLDSYNSITTDKNLQSSPRLYIENIAKNTIKKLNILILEDADEILAKRTDGNSIMNTILNAYDGITSKKKNKLIVSCNLESLSNVDPALIRKGRTFEIINFRSLDYKESVEVAKILGKDINKLNKQNTLSDIFNIEEQQEGSKDSLIRKVGFNA